ncbi:hypothetical protein Ciccas_011733, partial [Cichlidogyrus casuarinus]
MGPTYIYEEIYRQTRLIIDEQLLDSIYVPSKKAISEICHSLSMFDNRSTEDLRMIAHDCQASLVELQEDSIRILVIYLGLQIANSEFARVIFMDTTHNILSAQSEFKYTTCLVCKLPGGTACLLTAMHKKKTAVSYAAILKHFALQYGFGGREHPDCIIIDHGPAEKLAIEMAFESRTSIRHCTYHSIKLIEKEDLPRFTPEARKEVKELCYTAETQKRPNEEEFRKLAGNKKLEKIAFTTDQLSLVRQFIVDYPDRIDPAMITADSVKYQREKFKNKALAEHGEELCFLTRIGFDGRKYKSR